MVEPLVQSKSEPIGEVQKVTTVTNPVGQKNAAGTQINPATEDTLALVNTALQTAGITQTQLANILTELGQKTEPTDTQPISAASLPLPAGASAETTLAAVKTAVEIIDNFISGARGLVTEDNSAAILAKLDIALSTRATETTLAKLMPTTPAKYAVALTAANTEYSQALTNVKKFRIHLRDFTEFRLAYVTGKVATPTDPYETIPAGSEKYEDNLNIANLTLYFASAVAGKTAEIEAWS